MFLWSDDMTREGKVAMHFYHNGLDHSFFVYLKRLSFPFSIRGACFLPMLGAISCSGMHTSAIKSYNEAKLWFSPSFLSWCMKSLWIYRAAKSELELIQRKWASLPRLKRLSYVYLKDVPLFRTLNEYLYYVSGFLYYLSATVNPILYNLMSLKYRHAFRQTLCGRNSLWRRGLGTTRWKPQTFCAISKTNLI